MTSLADGGTFTDAANSLSIVQNSHSASGVTFTVQVSAAPKGADLLETAVGKPPTLALPGTSFSATDTVKNQGAAAAGASLTRYYLSAGQQKTAGAVLLGGGRSVPSLAAGQVSSGSASVTIPSSMPLGTYYLLACADDLNAVAETKETNNCLAAAGRVKVTRSASWNQR